MAKKQTGTKNPKTRPAAAKTTATQKVPSKKAAPKKQSEKRREEQAVGAGEAQAANENARSIIIDPAQQKKELRLCRGNVVHFVNEYGWTYDPREPEPEKQFRLFPRQCEFLLWLCEREKKQEDDVAEKCRDVGFTWLCCSYAVHGWLFRQGFRCGFGSRKLDLVDKLGDPGSIFEKMRYFLDRLPQWMLPSDYSCDYCKIINRDNGATLTGEGGGNIGRGDRASIYFIDEAAFLEHSHRVDAALSHTSRCKTWVSTANGQSNAFYRKRMSGRFEVFTFTWRDDPRKGEQWYERQKETLDPVTLAQEVDIDYSASVDGVCIPAAWAMAAVTLLDRHPELKPKHEARLVAAYDIAAGGRDLNVLGFRSGIVVTEILSWGGVNATVSACKVRDECERRRVRNLHYDSGGGYGEAMAALIRDGVNFDAPGLNGGESPSDAVWPEGRNSKEKFINARAEWWWSLRERFRRTYEMQEGEATFPVDELISIPNHPDLLRDLSAPLCEVTSSGKVLIESKEKMRVRGIKSPDFADMLAYLFAEEEKPARIVFHDSALRALRRL